MGEVGGGRKMGIRRVARNNGRMEGNWEGVEVNGRDNERRGRNRREY